MNTRFIEAALPSDYELRLEPTMTEPEINPITGEEGPRWVEIDMVNVRTRRVVQIQVDVNLCDCETNREMAEWLRWVIYNETAYLL